MDNNIKIYRAIPSSTIEGNTNTTIVVGNLNLYPINL